MRLMCPACRSESVCRTDITAEIIVCRCDDCHAQFTIRLQPSIVTKPVLPTVAKW